MDSNLRLQQRVLCSIVLSLSFLGPVLCSFNAHAESEAYRRQVKFETDRAADFHRFLKYLQQIDNERTSAVPGYKVTKVKEAADFEQARKLYAEWVKQQERKKPTEEYIERMLASEAAKEERDKEAIRQEFVKLQKEIERAIANTRLDEAEEYQLDR